MQKKPKKSIVIGIGILVLAFIATVGVLYFTKHENNAKVMRVQSNGKGLSSFISYSGCGVPILVDFDKKKVDKVAISAEKGILLAKIDDRKPVKTITRQSPEVVHWRYTENMGIEKENQEVDTVTVIAYRGEKVVEQKNIPIMLNEEWSYIAMQCDAYNLDWEGKPEEEN